MIRPLSLLVVSGLLLGGTEVADAQAAQPGIEYEMTIEGMPAQPKTTIKIESWSWGATALDQDNEVTADKPPVAIKKSRALNAQDFFFVMGQSPASAMLLEAMVVKKALVKVTLHVKSPIQGQGFELVLKDVKVGSYQTGGSSYGGNLPMDQLSFSYKSAKLTVSSGNGKHSADLTAN